MLELCCAMKPSARPLYTDRPRPSSHNELYLGQPRGLNDIKQTEIDRSYVRSNSYGMCSAGSILDPAASLKGILQCIQLVPQA
jgi:hypothetical protein